MYFILQIQLTNVSYIINVSYLTNVSYLIDIYFLINVSYPTYFTGGSLSNVATPH